MGLTSRETYKRREDAEESYAHKFRLLSMANDFVKLYRKKFDFQDIYRCAIRDPGNKTLKLPHGKTAQTWEEAVRKIEHHKNRLRAIRMHRAAVKELNKRHAGEGSNPSWVLINRYGAEYDEIRSGLEKTVR